MTRRARGPSAVWLDDIDLSLYVTSLDIRQSIQSIGFDWIRNGMAINYGLPETTATIEGVWTEEIDRLLHPVAHTYAVLGGSYDSPPTFHAEWTVKDVTVNVALSGQWAYAVTLPAPCPLPSLRLTFVLDDRPAPVEPAFTVTPWGARSLTLEELARQRQAKTEAQARARQLLLRHLSETQRTEFKATSVITEVLPPPYGTARISASTVRLLDDQYPDTTRARYCLVPQIDEAILPWEDVILARLLLLRHDPVGFFRTANKIG